MIVKKKGKLTLVAVEHGFNHAWIFLIPPQQTNATGFNQSRQPRYSDLNEEQLETSVNTPEMLRKVGAIVVMLAVACG